MRVEGMMMIVDGMLGSCFFLYFFVFWSVFSVVRSCR